MPAHHLAEWAAFEHVYGPILVHERVDIGLSRLLFLLARVYHDPKRPDPRWVDYLPPYMQWREEAKEQDPAILEAVLQGAIRGA